MPDMNVDLHLAVLIESMKEGMMESWVFTGHGWSQALQLRCQ